MKKVKVNINSLFFCAACMFLIFYGTCFADMKQYDEMNIIHPFVESVVESGSSHRNSRVNGSHWTETLDLKSLYRISRGVGVVIAVIDTGVDFDNTVFANNLFCNYKDIPDDGIDNDQNGFIDDTCGWDFGDDDNLPLDTNGHGTGMAGIIVQASPGALIVPIKINQDHFGTFETEDLIAALKYAVDIGADVINLSLTLAQENDEVQRIILNAIEEKCIVVTSPGNDGQNIKFPAIMEETITVGSIDSDEIRADFSPQGTELDFLTMGKDVSSYSLNGNSAILSGTSVSAAIVSATAALLKGMNPSLTQESVKYLLIKSSKDIFEIGKDHESGWGVLQFDLLSIISTPLLTLRDKPNYSLSGDEELLKYDDSLSKIYYYLPPTDTLTSIFICLVKESNIWQLDCSGSWVPYSMGDEFIKFSEFNIDQTSYEGCLFGNNCIFPNKGFSSLESGFYQMTILLMDQDDKLSAPFTWEHLFL